MKYLTEDQIIAVNERVLFKMGQPLIGIQYYEGLAMVVEQVQMVVFGHELYPTIWLKAAFILQKITKKHIFYDGNKRTAYLAMLLFLVLAKNGYELKLDPKEAEAIIMKVTISSDSEEIMLELSSFIETHCCKIQ